MLLYSAGESILKQLGRHKTSLKTLVFKSKFQNVKQLYALVCETLKYRKTLEEIINETKILKGAKMSKEFCMLLLYDFLFGKGVRGGGKHKQFVDSRKSMLQSALARLKIKHKVIKNEDLCVEAVEIPKYIRVNSLITSTESAIETFTENGFTKVSCDQKLEEKQFKVDAHISNLLCFPPSTDLHDNLLYTSGAAIFQDKASCIPAFVLNPPTDAQVIDACAAPGNKTSHLAAIMNNSGRIFAFDISEERTVTMRKLLNKAKVSNCTVVSCDFLAVSANDRKYSQVSHVLVDPSCSGSGIVSRLSHLTDSKPCTKSRLDSLHNFQVKILNHALTFPSVEKVVYSTCSIHERENEEVVAEVLRHNSNFCLGHVIPAWLGRGHASVFSEAEKCVRCDPKNHDTNGFFVALFVRIV